MADNNPLHEQTRFLIVKNSAMCCCTHFPIFIYHAPMAYLKYKVSETFLKCDISPP